MQAEPEHSMSGAPKPPAPTEKTYYQSRKSWGPSKYPTMGFKNSREDGLRPLDREAHVMDYTQINGVMPTAFERGIAPDQKTMGRYNNSFEPNL